MVNNNKKENKNTFFIGKNSKVFGIANVIDNQLGKESDTFVINARGFQVVRAHNILEIMKRLGCSFDFGIEAILDKKDDGGWLYCEKITIVKPVAKKTKG